MTEEQFRARMRDEVNTLLESWFVAGAEDTPSDDVVHEENIPANVYSALCWMKEQTR